ncbi:hypothetical protein [Serratia entomophila]|uniref:Uncharacterized protein n=1 Tax=Serratia entomophila TaxID=42906 RepID=A0ABY5CVM3_9GAMM|nr:hypothetical protein [Serratia entomophila]UIW19512.1 hypothetical protein KHA73_06060 [Serratia entomophila]USV02037.1 hypothetical protein KFQ06_05810 [Serratia entomophila]
MENFGAFPDDYSFDNTVAFQSAFNAAAKKGGGEVIAAGNLLTRLIATDLFIMVFYFNFLFFVFLSYAPEGKTINKKVSRSCSG